MIVLCEKGPAAGQTHDVPDDTDHFDYPAGGVKHRYLRTERVDPGEHGDDTETVVFIWDPWSQAEGAKSGMSKQDYERSCR